MPVALCLKNDLDIVESAPVAVFLRVPYSMGNSTVKATKIGEKAGPWSCVKPMIYYYPSPGY